MVTECCAAHPEVSGCPWAVPVTKTTESTRKCSVWRHSTITQPRQHHTGGWWSCTHSLLKGVINNKYICWEWGKLWFNPSQQLRPRPWGADRIQQIGVFFWKCGQPLLGWGALGSHHLLAQHSPQPPPQRSYLHSLHLQFHVILSGGLPVFPLFPAISIFPVFHFLSVVQDHRTILWSKSKKQVWVT